MTAHTNGRPEDRPAIRILHAVNTIFARVYHQLDVLNACPIPRRGPAILVCNHISSLDPMLLQSACHQRLITWMMAEEYLKLPAMGWFFRAVGIIPVQRSGRDSGPLRAAIRALQAGQVLGVFPEAKIASTRELLPFQTGVALMAIKAGVDVFPAYLDGTQRNKPMLEACLRPNSARVMFGPKVEFDRTQTNRPALDAATVQIKAAIENLRNEMISTSRFG